MTHLATSGMSSCATMAISGFKDNQYTMNEAYKDSETVPNSEGMSVDEFASKIIYPVSQPLGRTKDLPFTKLMEDIEDSDLRSKFTLACLAAHQYALKDKYWHKELLKWGFFLAHKTNNTIGGVNYIYIRAPLNIAVEPHEMI